MLDSLDWLFNFVALVFWAAIIATLIIGVVWLGSLPGSIARDRAHAQADAVNVMGWLGLLFLPLWPLAMVWAFYCAPGAAAVPSREVQR